MANPGYYESDPGDLIVLPVQARYESLLRTIRQSGVYQETIRGESTGHTFLTRRELNPVFHLSVDELDAYQAVYDAFSNTTAFYYVPDSDDLDGAIWVKLIEADFTPTKLPPRAKAPRQRYEFIMHMIEQKPPVEILA